MPSLRFYGGKRIGQDYNRENLKVTLASSWPLGVNSAYVQQAEWTYLVCGTISTRRATWTEGRARRPGVDVIVVW